MISSPIKYQTSRLDIVPEIKSHLDFSKKVFVDLLAGSGSVYSNVLEDYDRIYVNDIIGDLINIQKMIIIEPETTLDVIRQKLPPEMDSSVYSELRDEYNSSRDPYILYILLSYCTNGLIRFNKSLEFNQTFSKSGENSIDESAILEFANEVSPFANKMTFATASYEAVNCNKDCMVFIDPPNTKVNAGYNAYWTKDASSGIIQYCRKISDRKASFAILAEENNPSINGLSDELQVNVHRITDDLNLYTNY